MFLSPLFFFTEEGWISFPLYLKLPILYLSGTVNGEVTLEADRHSEMYSGLHCTVRLLQPLQQM